MRPRACAMKPNSLCASAPLPLLCLQLERLLLFHCAVSDPGLLSALPRCPTLARLELNNFWLASAAGLQAASAAAVQAGGCLAEVLLDGTALPLPLPSKTTAGGLRSRRPSSSTGGTPPIGLQPATAVAGSGAASPQKPPRSAPRGGTVLPAHVLAHDERLVYSREELLGLARGQAAGRGASGAAEQQLRQLLPPDLRSPANIQP